MSLKDKNMNINVRKTLLLMKRKGYLEKRSRLGEEYWIESKRVKSLLKEGKTREEISEILENEYEEAGKELCEELK